MQGVKQKNIKEFYQTIKKGTLFIMTMFPQNTHL